MFDYYTLFRHRHRKRIFPIVLYLTPGAGGIVDETYVEEFFGDEFLRFRYKAIGLPDLSADDYITRPNPLGPTLSALMRFRRGISFARRKTAILRQRAIIETNEARRVLLLNLIDDAIRLDEAQQGEFRQLIGAPELGEVRQMITSYEQRGIEIGLKQGLTQGLLQGQLQGKHWAALKFLQTRFGAPSLAVQSRIEAITDPEELDKLVERIASAESLEAINQYLN